MPLGFERLNERSQRPNANINFIKSLASSSPQDQRIAKDFLERIAAQCYPVMKKEYISVMALEEYPPNPEFLGRNFNAGEVIQLVLKDKAGRWLSFKFVQMVMMHELAHCKQMNHSKYFWQVRNVYAEHMKELWAKQYEGEGLWGRGLHLVTGAMLHNRPPDNDDIPEHLCGGAYRRSRGRKRKRGDVDGATEDKPKVSYAERQQKRIAKKFGVHGEGQGLGEDELVRGGLEVGKKRGGKPRVANSKRGRELRASAALARFDALKRTQAVEKTPELVDDDGSETESDDDEYGDSLAILETMGRLHDQEQRELYRVCGDEGESNEGGKDEMDELMLIGSDDFEKNSEGKKGPSSNNAAVKAGGLLSNEQLDADSETEDEAETADSNNSSVDAASEKATTTISTPSPEQKSSLETEQKSSLETEQVVDTTTALPETRANIYDCPTCTLTNAPDSATCAACGNVLQPKLMPNHWRCKSEACTASQYVNPGDAGRCGLCGAQKPIVQIKGSGVADSASFTRADVLRWD